jgi:subtilase family serine protease
VTASGDDGSGAGWPASSPNVVSVGGTSLYVDGAGDTVLEKAWSGSGGGFSVLEREPAYQWGVQRRGRRSSPDVAMVADPNTGVLVLVIDPASGQPTWSVFGGTSLSAQLFGGLVAVADQGRALAGLGSLDGPTQTLPLLYSLATTDFRDITSGSNGHRATRGYDLVTGLGSPLGSRLVSDLSNPSIHINIPFSPLKAKSGRLQKRAAAIHIEAAARRHSSDRLASIAVFQRNVPVGVAEKSRPRGDAHGRRIV